MKVNSEISNVVLCLVIIACITTLSSGKEPVSLIYGIIVFIFAVDFKKVQDKKVEKNELIIMFGVMVWLVMDTIVGFIDISQLLNVWALIVSTGAFWINYRSRNDGAKVKES